MRSLVDDATRRWHSGRRLVERSQRLVQRVELTLTTAEIRLAEAGSSLLPLPWPTNPSERSREPPGGR